MKFESKKSSIPLDPYLAVIGRYTKSKEYLEFFMNNNVAIPVTSGCVVLNGRSLSVDFFLGRSKSKGEDLIKVFESYENRVPSSYLPVCQVNEIDFLCLGADSKIYLWDRGVNDLYFDSSNPDTYLPQNVNLLRVFDSFKELLESIVECHVEVEEFEDDYDNPNIPFEDEDIEDDFLHPELFFKQSEDAVEIQLKKLKLSEKGRQLLGIFSKKGLL